MQVNTLFWKFFIKQFFDFCAYASLGWVLANIVLHFAGV